MAVEIPEQSTTSQPPLLASTDRALQRIEHTLASVHVSRARTEYAAKDLEKLADTDVFLSPSDPSIVKEDLLAQLSYVRKLKFNYLEQYAKGKYINTVISEEPPDVDEDTLVELQDMARSTKSELKVAKKTYENTISEIEDLAPQVEALYEQTKRDETELRSLTSSILNAQLALSRLRARHPEPRLTVTQATSIVDSQVERMMALTEEQASLDEQLEAKKKQIKDTTRALDRERNEKREAEAVLAPLTPKGGAEDLTISRLYEWFTTYLSLYQRLLSIHSFSRPSTNSVNITYTLPELVTVNLVFIPKTLRLANASLVEPVPRAWERVDIGELVEVACTSGDVRMFVALLGARLRKRE